MKSWIHLFMTLSLVISIVNANEIGGDYIKASDSPQSHSSSGVRNLKIRTTPLDNYYTIVANFDTPQNPYNKIILGYTCLIYKFFNASHIHLDPFKTFSLSKTTTTFSVSIMEYNRNFYIKVTPKYEGEEINEKHSAVRHLFYAYDYDGERKLTDTENYGFAPNYDDSTITRHRNDTCNLKVKWSYPSNIEYKYYVGRFIARLSTVYNLDYLMEKEFMEREAFSHTFTNITLGAEYELAIFAIPKNGGNEFVLRNYVSSRKFFVL